MKSIKYILTIYLLSVFICSCKKTDIVNPGPISSITIVNATVDSQPIVPDFNINPVLYYSVAQNIPYGNSFVYSIQSGIVPLNIAQISDTTHTIFKGSFNLKPATIYSLFMAGQISSAGSQVDTLLTIDHPPYHSVKDSVAGVRFVNLSPGSNPISVNIAGSTNGSEIIGLPYKGVSAFKAYTYTANTPSTGDYLFEIRDSGSGTLLTTFDYSNMARFNNVTIVLNGLPGNQTAFLVNNY